MRDGDRTVMTMANDFQGDPTEFAMVIPVPTVVKREQIAVAEKALLDHLDAYSSPRLVEYHDPNPRAGADFEGLERTASAAPRCTDGEDAGRTHEKPRRHHRGPLHRGGVRHPDPLRHAERGLETWLRESGYRIPRGASEVLGSHIRQQMRSSWPA